MLDEELHTSYLKQLHLPKDMDNLFESDAKEFQKVMMMYSCAIKEVKTKLQVLNDEFSMTKNRNPIEAGQHRNQIEKERLSDYG